ncbi:MAG: hypothetical protein H7838_09875 [Magnetococcus sp. DMHC-8]
MVATLALLAIVAGTSVPLLHMLLEAHGLATVMAPAASAGTLAMERMVREVRQAQWDTLQVADHAITFVSAAGETTRLHQTRPGDAGIYLVKNGDERLLAQVVAAGSLSFTRLAPANRLVGISFTLNTPLADGTALVLPLATAVHVPP